MPGVFPETSMRPDTSDPMVSLLPKFTPNFFKFLPAGVEIYFS